MVTETLAYVYMEVYAYKWGYLKGYWRVAGSPVMSRAASTANLRKAGYTFLSDEYAKWNT